MKKKYVEFDKLNLEELSKEFQSKEPFNYIAIDNFFTEEVINETLTDFNNENFESWDKRNHDKIQIKWRSDWKDDSDVPANTLNLINFLNGGTFLRFYLS